MSSLLIAIGVAFGGRASGDFIQGRETCVALAFQSALATFSACGYSVHCGLAQTMGSRLAQS